MRLSHPRGSWPVWSMLAAALAVLTVSLASSATLEGSRLVRMGRSAQRLEAADGIPHAHEQDEPDAAPAGLVVDRVMEAGALGAVHASPPGRTSIAPTRLRGSTSHLVWPIHTPALAGAPPGDGIRLTHHDLRPRLVRTIRPALGRAPPSA
jgi:hypothetical protein